MHQGGRDQGGHAFPQVDVRKLGDAGSERLRRPHGELRPVGRSRSRDDDRGRTRRGVRDRAIVTIRQELVERRLVRVIATEVHHDPRRKRQLVGRDRSERRAQVLFADE